MRVRILTKENFIKSKWEGGETTQLAIYPEGSHLSKRDFKWRISTATFTGTESRFSDFTGFKRFLLPVYGEISINHKGHYMKTLNAYEIDSFDGSWESNSYNSPDCRDYNFIVKEGHQAGLIIAELDKAYTFNKSSSVTLYSLGPFEICINENNRLIQIDGESLVYIETEKDLELSVSKMNKPVIITEFLE